MDELYDEICIAADQASFSDWEYNSDQDEAEFLRIYYKETRRKSELYRKNIAFGITDVINDSEQTLQVKVDLLLRVIIEQLPVPANVYQKIINQLATLCLTKTDYRKLALLKQHVFYLKSQYKKKITNRIKNRRDKLNFLSGVE